jgi:hypothetical protein
MESAASYEMSVNVNEELCLLGCEALSLGGGFLTFGQKAVLHPQELSKSSRIAFILVGTTHPMTWCRILEDPNPPQHGREKLK